MIITISEDSVIIEISDGVRYGFTYNQLEDIKKAIEIIKYFESCKYILTARISVS